MGSPWLGTCWTLAHASQTQVRRGRGSPINLTGPYVRLPGDHEIGWTFVLSWGARSRGTRLHGGPSLGRVRSHDCMMSYYLDRGLSRRPWV